MTNADRLVRTKYVQQLESVAGDSESAISDQVYQSDALIPCSSIQTNLFGTTCI
jgi:hypothetical protein